MDYENYMELYEAVYFFDKIFTGNLNKMPLKMPDEVFMNCGIHESVYTAVMRILVASNLLKVDSSGYKLTPAHRNKHNHILTNIIYKNDTSRYIQLFEKAANPKQFFFDSISESESEIYAQCNFQVTYAIGKEVAHRFKFAHKKVLELGGNSGGLGTAIVTAHNKCDYTVVDTPVPCLVGREYNTTNGLNITFIEANVFELNLPDKTYDYVILMNLLHDFDDEKCLDIVENVKRYCHLKTKLLIIEDVLTSDFDPKAMVMHGLRLSAECRGGTQRTKESLSKLFSGANYVLEETFNINPYNEALIFGSNN